LPRLNPRTDEEDQTESETPDSNPQAKSEPSSAALHKVAQPLFPARQSADFGKVTTAMRTCAGCPAFSLNLCSAVGKVREASGQCPDLLPLSSSTHAIPARRMISHPKEWSDFVTIICGGWAASSITLPDGRRQILSFLMPGDLVSATFLLEPMMGRSVEAITPVTCRKYKRSDFKALLFKYPPVLEKLSETWNEERAQADQLALDLGRRAANERIARLILNLMEKAEKRGMKRGPIVEFPLRQRHIADATGLTPVHVSKVIGVFQRDGLIEISGRSLIILNEAELRRVAEWH
jgi:CRP/FNR family transcriptional regulator